MSPGSVTEHQYWDQRALGETGNELNEDGKPRSKSKWFSKKKKINESVENFDEVAKLMEEAFFGSGTSVPRKASKIKNKEKDKDKDKDKERENERERDNRKANQDACSSVSSDSHIHIPPNSLPMILPPKESLPELDTNSYESSQQLFVQVPVPEPQVVASSTSTSQTPTTMVPLTLQTPKAHLPVAFAPRTAYTSPPKKQALLQQPEGEPLPSIASESYPLPNQQQDISELQLDTKPSVSPEESKKFKNLPFNMFKIKKSSGKQSQEQENMTLSPTIKTQLSEVEGSTAPQSGYVGLGLFQSAVDLVVITSPSKAKKKRESDEYVPYEYQEELEGPLMERVAVPESREIVGFVMPVKELADYDLQRNEAALDNWDSWVNQLESFERVLSDKSAEKKVGKRFKKFKKSKDKGKGSSPPLPLPRISPEDDRSSIFSDGTDLPRPSMSMTYDMNEDLNHNINNTNDMVDRPSFQSTHSTILGQDMIIHQLSAQQAKKRWWDPKRKEMTSFFATSDTVSISQQVQERYLATLLKSNRDEHEQQDQQQDLYQPDGGEEEEHDYEREEALNALLENSRTIMSLPIPGLDSRTSSYSSTRELPMSNKPAGSKPMVDHSKEPRLNSKSSTISTSTSTSTSTSNSKPKLMSISTPLAQLLELSNAEELWQYVQQAKTYAASRMNKGDKRSAAIALKRAQALEARWQQVLLEMASSNGDEEELLLDDDDEEEEEDHPEDREGEGEGEDDGHMDEDEIWATTSAPSFGLIDMKSSADKHKYVQPVSSAAGSISEYEQREDDHRGYGNNADSTNNNNDEDDEELTRRHLHIRKVTSRSDSAPDMYSKYKVNRHTATTLSSMASLAKSTEESVGGDRDYRGNDDGDDDDAPREPEGLLGPDATLDELLETTNKEHLEIYIKRLKTDTVAKARNGSKYAALQSMKNVKLLQQRLVELEEEDDDDEENDSDDEENDDDHHGERKGVVETHA
ncbi:hypothetical protein BGZ65_005178 [Modicella reniformis]|uniref:Uncharacterized protein n=1 Tax=Modicella reniformis TaxID=1440133 RepID=A0A9P6IKA9_9FUNG|nr:hypothetical protein BGZ65_005178 [Modicella reniformis]